MNRFQILSKFVFAFALVFMFSLSASAQKAQTSSQNQQQNAVELPNAITPVYKQETSTQRTNNTNKLTIKKLENTIESTAESHYTGNERRSDQTTTVKVKRNPWSTTLPVDIIKQSDKN